MLYCTGDAGVYELTKVCESAYHVICGFGWRHCPCNMTIKWNVWIRKKIYLIWSYDTFLNDVNLFYTNCVWYMTHSYVTDHNRSLSYQLEMICLILLSMRHAFVNLYLWICICFAHFAVAYCVEKMKTGKGKIWKTNDNKRKKWKNNKMEDPGRL